MLNRIKHVGSRLIHKKYQQSEMQALHHCIAALLYQFPSSWMIRPVVYFWLLYSTSSTAIASFVRSELGVISMRLSVIFLAHTLLF